MGPDTRPPPHPRDRTLTAPPPRNRTREQRSASPDYRNFDPAAAAPHGHEEAGKAALRPPGVHVEQGYGGTYAVMAGAGGPVAGMPVPGGGRADARGPFASPSPPPFSGTGETGNAMQGPPGMAMAVQQQQQQQQQFFPSAQIQIPVEVECLKELLQIVNTLDRPTQVNIRDSLRRLAASAENRKKKGAAVAAGAKGGGVHGGAGGGAQWAAAAKSRPDRTSSRDLIDRSVAQLLYSTTAGQAAGDIAAGLRGDTDGAEEPDRPR